jgi:hypothetical protein
MLKLCCTMLRFSLRISSMRRNNYYLLLNGKKSHMRRKTHVNTCFKHVKTCLKVKTCINTCSMCFPSHVWIFSVRVVTVKLMSVCKSMWPVWGRRQCYNILQQNVFFFWINVTCSIVGEQFSLKTHGLLVEHLFFTLTILFF